MSLIPYCTFLVLSVLPYVAAQSGGEGKVFVGTNENDTTQVYTFNVNYGSSALSMPVYLLATNETTGEPIDFTSDVQVTCELQPADDSGYCTVLFATVTIPVPPSPGPIFEDIPFNNLVPGRSTLVRCWGVSTTDLQFTKTGSISQSYAFEVQPAGTVNFFDSLIVIENKPSDQIVSGNFLLQLSEIPSSANVSVECFINTTSIIDPLRVDMMAMLVEVGQQRFQMNYNLTKKGNPVPVYCVAESIDPGGFSQFNQSSSTGQTSMFMIQQGSASLLPQVTVLKTTTMNAFLVLNEAPVVETTFYCTIQEVNSTAMANDIAADTVCIGQDDVISPTAAPIPVVTNPPSQDTTTDSTGTGNPFQTATSPVTASAPTAAVTNTPAGPTTPMATSQAPTTSVPATSPAPGTTGQEPLPTTTATPTNNTSKWQIIQTKYVFTVGGPIFQTITINRTSPVEIFTEELVVTKCCAPESMNSASPQFVNVSATMLTAAYNTPDQAINWTIATPSDQLTTATFIPNPGYVNVAPCPCNVDAGACAADCCCDTDCTTDDIMTFDCIQGPEGGYPAATPRSQCNATLVYQDDWFPIMCVQFENSAFLGYYYFNQPLIQSATGFQRANGIYYSNYTFSPTPNLFPSSSQPDNSYKEGVSIKTGIPKDSVSKDYYIGSNYRLTLPSRTWTGNCIWTNPVRYLKDNYQTCVYKMKEELCSDYSPLNALMYAQSSLWSGRTGSVVLEDSQSQTIAETNVNYLCAGSDTQYTSRYLKSTDTVDDVMPQGQVFLFGYQLPVNQDGDIDCNFDSATGAYVCVNQTQDTAKSPTPTPPRCSFDNGYTRPPTPIYDPDTNICSNAVLDVFYNFTWNGSIIVFLNATVVLGDIPLEVSKVTNVTVKYTEVNEINNQTVKVSKTNTTEVTQTYITQFMQIFETLFSSYSYAINNDTTVQNLTESGTDRLPRSGNPGYEYDLPVISGTAVLNDTTGEFLYMDANSSQRLSLWDPSQAGLCYDAGTKLTPFGQNSFTSCVLRLSLTQLEDCENLRKMVLNRQDSVMPSSYVSLGGNPSYINIDDWTQVFRQDVSSTINVTLPPTTTEQPFVTGTGETTETSTVTAQQTTSGLNNDNFTTITYPYLDSVKGRCPNVTSGITVTIMYAEAGLSNFHPIYQIVGAQINYTLSTWQMFCSGSLGGACYGNDSAYNADGTQKIQPFIVSTAVNYIKVPAQAVPPMTEYQQRIYVPPTVCKYDACWQEFFYPWTKFNIGGYETYSVVIGLIFLIYGIGLVLIMRPISRWGV